MRGTPAGAPRLAARGFDQAYISTTTARGVPGTAMPAFATVLSRRDLTAVVAYVATLNGIANPSITASGATTGTREPSLSPEAERGRELFYDAVRGFGRCSTCHEVKGVGISVTTPIARIPAGAQALRALPTPNVSTAIVDGESIPVLVVSKRARTVMFYDLTSPPPVLRTVNPSALKITDGSNWRHASVIGGYSDAELAAILAFLREVVR
jgi:mono/diheme cytochrome c family protein